MSFLTEYFDEYREHPIRKTKICRPEERYAKLAGKWLDTHKVGSQDKAWTDEEVDAFIQQTMQSVRGQSTYYNDFCAHLSQEFKTREFVPRIKRLRPCAEELQEAKARKEEVIAPTKKLAMKDTELMKVAKEIYELDMDSPTLQPLPTAMRVYGYTRRRNWHTGISEYQHGIARLAYDMIKHDKIPPYVAHNGCRPRWPIPPDGRQPEHDIVPFNQERLY